VELSSSVAATPDSAAPLDALPAPPDAPAVAPADCVVPPSPTVDPADASDPRADEADVDPVDDALLADRPLLLDVPDVLLELDDPDDLPVLPRDRDVERPDDPDPPLELVLVVERLEDVVLVDERLDVEERPDDPDPLDERLDVEERPDDPDPLDERLDVEERPLAPVDAVWLLDELSSWSSSSEGQLSGSGRPSRRLETYVVWPRRS
jgi:hypothetical protein